MQWGKGADLPPKVSRSRPAQQASTKCQSGLKGQPPSQHQMENVTCMQQAPESAPSRTSRHDQQRPLPGRANTTEGSFTHPGRASSTACNCTVVSCWEEPSGADKAGAVTGTGPTAHARVLMQDAQGSPPVEGLCPRSSAAEGERHEQEAGGHHDGVTAGKGDDGVGAVISSSKNQQEGALPNKIMNEKCVWRLVSFPTATLGGAPPGAQSAHLADMQVWQSCNAWPIHARPGAPP